MKRILFFVVTFIFMMSSCSRQRFQTNAYKELSKEHQILAILPVEMVMTGRIPKELTEEDINNIEEGESKAFQMALFSELSRGSGSRRNEIGVNFQHYDATNQLLEEAGIDFRTAWTTSPVKLAEILGVDAVVKARVEKQQYLTDLEGFGITLASRVANVLLPGSPFGGFVRTRTSDVWASCSVLDSQSGVSVWASREKCPTYWNYPTQEVVTRIARAMCRRFPYRID